jgi:uncharacterized protein (TIGR02271 family)
MGIFGGIFGGDDVDRDKVEDVDADDDTQLRLRKEELDIAKNTVQTGEVELGKDIVEEHKVVDVPVMREEVVIERRSLDNETSDSPITDEESIRIPVTQETVDVGKHTVLTGEVTAHKRAVEETHHVDETLKREEAKVDTKGNPDVVNNGDYH